MKQTKLFEHFSAIKSKQEDIELSNHQIDEKTTNKLPFF
jgi:hypothetical protein